MKVSKEYTIEKAVEGLQSTDDKIEAQLEAMQRGEGFPAVDQGIEPIVVRRAPSWAARALNAVAWTGIAVLSVAIMWPLYVVYLAGRSIAQGIAKAYSNVTPAAFPTHK